MQCNGIQEKLSGYIDGQLSSEEKLKIEGHIKTCVTCSSVLEDLKNTITHMQGLEEVEPPPWLEQKVMASVREEAEQKRDILRRLFFPLHVKIPIEVFATIAIAVTAFYIFRTVEPEIKAPVQTFDEQVVVESEADKAVPGKEATEEIPLPQDRDRKAAYSVRTETQLPQVPESKAAPHITEPAEEKKVREEAPDVLEEERVPRKMYRALGVKKEKMAPAPAAGFQITVQIAGLSVYVTDINIAIENIKTAVKDTGGEITETEAFEDRNIITARLEAQEVDRLVRKIHLIGEVDKKAMIYKPGGDVLIRIEVLKQSAGPQQ